MHSVYIRAYILYHYRSTIAVIQKTHCSRCGLIAHSSIIRCLQYNDIATPIMHIITSAGGVHVWRVREVSSLRIGLRSIELYSSN